MPFDSTSAPDAAPASPPPPPPVRPWTVEDLPALDPDPFFDQLLRDEPITRISLPYGDGYAWLVTRYEDVRAVTSDPRFSRAELVGRRVTSMTPQAVASQTAGLQYVEPPPPPGPRPPAPPPPGPPVALVRHRLTVLPRDRRGSPRP
ncbi:hypothetical protein ACFVZ6_23640, partial [Streptomyces sp. NPDC059597]